MYLGRIVEQGLTQEVLTRPLHPYTQALVASVPVPDPAAQPPALVAGEIPSPWAKPSGCHFRTRCPLAMPVCAELSPPLLEVDTGRRVLDPGVRRLGFWDGASLSGEGIFRQADRHETETVEDLAARAEMSSAVAEAMERLPADQRTAIILKEYHGLTFQEVAELMNCPLSTAKTRLYQGLALLRRYLAEQGKFDPAAARPKTTLTRKES